jgi:hypothetical protein
MSIVATVAKSFGNAFVAFLQSSGNPQGRGTVFQPQTLTRGQVAMYTAELTETYGHAYTAMLQANAKR